MSTALSPTTTRRRPMLWMLIVLSLLATIVSTGTLAPDPAAAGGDPHCYLHSCNGQDPLRMHCHRDARTLEEVSVSGARIQIRYSPSCRAAWGRSIAPSNYNPGTGFVNIFGATTRSTLENGNLERQFNGRISGNQIVAGYKWTQMVSFNNWVRVCHSSSWYGARPVRAHQECTRIR